MKLFFKTIVVLLLTNMASYANDTRIGELDALLSEQKYDQLLITLAPEKFHKFPSFFNRSTDMKWLHEKEKLGYVPLLYILAYRSIDDNKEDAVKIYAKARIYGFLDASECATPTRIPWNLILEQSFPELYKMRKELPLIYLQGADDALKGDENRTERPSASWYCKYSTNENLLLPEQAENARKARRVKMLEDNARKLAIGKDE